MAASKFPQGLPMLRALLSLLLFFLLFAAQLPAADWPQFRGPNRDGASPDNATPTQWDKSKNVLWATNVPGHGSSSPVVYKGKIYLTCYSGYGFDERSP